MLRRMALRRPPFLVGFLLGVTGFFLINSPQRCSETTDSLIRPIINLQTEDVETNKAYTTALRPRFYSSELGIKEKLLAISLSDQEDFNKLGKAVNDTFSSHASKLIFYVCSDSTANSSATPNVVIVNGQCNRLLYHALSHVAARQISSDYDFVLVARDSTYLRGDNLMSLVNHISMSKSVYMGVPLSTDSRICDIEFGVLFSKSVFSRVLANLKKCKEYNKIMDDENTLICVSKFIEIPCQTNLGNNEYVSVDAESKSASLLLTHPQRSVISVSPLTFNYNFYRLNYKLDLHTSNKVKRQLVGISNNIADINERCDLANFWPHDLKRFFKPKRRFDVIRTCYFNKTHLFWNNDGKVTGPLNDVHTRDIENILDACERHLQSKIELLNGWITVDPTVGSRYIVDAFVDGRLRRLRIVRSLSLSELTPMPYVTENSKVSIVIFVYGDEVTQVLEFLHNYSLLMERGDNSMLLLVFAVREKVGEKTGFDSVRKSAELYSKQYAHKQSKIAILKIRCPEFRPEFGLADIVASKLPSEEILLMIQPNTVITEVFLNHVRLNTMKRKQIFLPIPFTLYKTVTPVDDLHTNADTGFFDYENVDTYSVFVSDYLRIRRSMPNIPLATVSADLQRRVYESSTYRIAEVFLATKQLHVMRATEPELRLKPMKGNCEFATSNVLQKKHCNRTKKISLGNKKRLALMIAS